MSERITLQTSDGVIIVGDWVPPAGGADPAAQVALMLHMMPADRTSWQPLSEKLAAAGVGSLAIDLRGHGESIHRISTDQNKLAPERSRGATFLSSRATSRDLDHKTFTDADHQGSRLDVDAALEWLNTKGYSTDHVIMIGASIGANLSIDAAARYPDIKKVVMLSGGLDYRGVKTDIAANQLRADQRVMLVASADDQHRSFESHKALTQMLGDRATVHEFTTAGHGTTMFAHVSTLIETIVSWITRDQLSS